MAVAKRLRTDDVAGGGTPQALVVGKSRAFRPLFEGNLGTADVRGNHITQQVITLHSFGSTDSFKVRVHSLGADGERVATDTVAFVRGTNATAAAIQAALRTATGDAALTVSGTTDAGPFTVTFVGKSKGIQPALELVTLSGCSGSVTRGALAYSDPEATTAGNGIVFDQESSRGKGDDVPLGYSIVSDGVGVTAKSTLVAPTVASAVGGSGEVVIDLTEVASGGTGGEVLWAIVDTDTGEVVVQDTQDADGDATVSSLDAGDYYLLAHTVTASGRVSPPTAKVYFTVA